MSAPPTRLVLRCLAAVVVVAAWAGCSSDTDGPDAVVGGAAGATADGSVDWDEVWRDDFDGAGVDATAWQRYHNTYGDGNAELACLTPDNVSVAEGTLTIEARAETITCPSGSTRRFSSGFLGSREVGRLYPLYARFEVRARVPHGQGLWPAFWLRHADGAGVAEVDVLEMFHSQRPGQVAQTLHFPNGLGRSAWSAIVDLETPVAGTGDWHTHAVEIVPDEASGGVRFTFLVDDEVTGSFVDPVASWRNGADPERTWDIAVNLAVGGRWVGEPDGTLGWLPELGRCSRDLSEPVDGPESCPTDEIVRAAFPARYEVDHIAVSIPAAR